MNIKTFFQYFSFFLLTTPSFLYTSTQKETQEIFEPFDQIDFFGNNYIYDEAFSNTITRNNNVTPLDILNIITDPNLPINAQTVLQKNLYLRTNPVNVRPLLDLPSQQLPLKNYCTTQHSPLFDIFYNETRRQNFTPYGTNLNDYLAFTSQELADLYKLIEEILQGDNPNPSFLNLLQTAQLFSPIRFEERRIGGVFSLFRRNECFSFYIGIPLYFIVHNINMDDSEKNAIANSDVFRYAGAGGGNSAALEAFLTEHLAHDLFGLGDTRLRFLWNKDMDHSCLRLGAELSLPTAATITERFIGGPVNSCPGQPNIDLVELVNKFDSKNLTYKTDIIDVGVQALDRFLLVAGDTHLGEQQVRIGPRIEWDYQPCETFTLHQALLCMIQPSYKTNRFYREIKTPEDFNRDYTVEADASANLQFLEDRLANLICPIKHATDVSTTTSCEYSLAGQWDYDCFRWAVGYDFWYRSAEKLCIIDSIEGNIPLDVCNAGRFSATDHKIYGSFTWHVDGLRHFWDFGATFDGSLGHRGIGRSFTFGLFGLLTW